jgi:hypothetical protein
MQSDNVSQIREQRFRGRRRHEELTNCGITEFTFTNRGTAHGSRDVFVFHNILQLLSFFFPFVVSVQ